MRSSSGFTLAELLIAMAVGSVVVGGAYASYAIVSRQYNKITDISRLHDNGRGALNTIVRDVRMAGYKDFDTKFGSISTPLSITDSGSNQCCDQIEITYDRTSSQRVRIDYNIEPYKNRQRLYKTTYTWDGANWVRSTTHPKGIVADYVEDLQFIGRDYTPSPNQIPQIVDVFLVVRSSREVRSTRKLYEKKTYSPGNYEIKEDDKFLRDEFSATVFVRNVSYGQ